jgi:hypothetical protein
LLARGPLTFTELTSGTGLAGPSIERTLAELRRSGAIADGSEGRLALTDDGRDRARAAAAREGEDLAREVERFHAGFLPLDRRLKEAVTRWQVRAVGGVEIANDHRDRGHDYAVLEDLGTIVSEVVARLAPLALLRGRYRRYGERLDAAASRARAGEVGCVSGLGHDSVHSIWWQLHSDVLAVLGRARGAMEA